MTEEEYFRPVERNEKLDAFLKDHPEPDIQSRLSFLLDQFPQIFDGKVNYLIDGGVAVSLLRPGSRTSQRIDVDIVAVSPEVQKFFAGTYEFGVTPVQFWLERRGFAYSEAAQELIMASYQEVSLPDGRTLLVVSPKLLAYTKSFLGLHLQSRPQDIDDLRMLGIREEIIRHFHDKLVRFSELANKAAAEASQ